MQTARSSFVARKMYQKHITLQKVQHPYVNSESLKSHILSCVCVCEDLGRNGGQRAGVGMGSEGSPASTQSVVKSLPSLEPCT